MSQSVNLPVSQTSAEDILNKMFSIPELAELALPEPVSLLPQTVGWLWLAGVLIVGAAGWRFYHLWLWRRDRWRREAVQLLNQARNNQRPDQLPVLIKRVMLMYIPRTDMTAQGAAPGSAPDSAYWLDQLEALNQRLGLDPERVGFQGESATLLSQISYCPSTEIPVQQTDELFNRVDNWLKELPHV